MHGCECSGVLHVLHRYFVCDVILRDLQTSHCGLPPYSNSDSMIFGNFVECFIVNSKGERESESEREIQKNRNSEIKTSLYIPVCG